MKAITLWQPWASLVAVGAKKYETRSWATNYRGPIAIHAGMKDGADLLTSTQINAVMKAFGNTRYEVAHNRGKGGVDYSWPAGAIIATAELVECHRIQRDPKTHRIVIYDSRGRQDSIPLSDKEILFGDYTPGRYAWELANVQMLPEPIPAKGKQGLWEWEGVVL